ncbi:hypothetical protein JVU11DRAFT_3699 [Chiua virens]|nr:hypothetical protein JVU11DRAFT_3699 [Chiua virens]
MQETERTANAYPDAATASARIIHSCLSRVPCRWQIEGRSEPCGTLITCAGVSAHFGDAHDIRNVGGNTLIHCMWEGCNKWIKRRNFVRHIREPHLSHIRPRK